MKKVIQPADLTANTTRLEQAEARTDQAEARLEQAEARTGQAEARIDQVEIRIDQAEIRAEQAKTRAESAETRTEQAENRIELAKTRTEQAETRTEQAETRAEQAITRAEQAETTLANIVHKEMELPGQIPTPPLTTSAVHETADRDLPLAQLTARQREILRLIAQGENTKQIADLLKISPKTVEYHRMKLMSGLNIHDIPGLVRFALRVGLIPAGG